MKQLLKLLPPLLLAFSALAQSPEQRGLEIAQEADRRDTGWQDQAAELKMVLKNKQGDSSSRKLRIRSLEVDGDGDKSMSIFDAPRDVKGTALLTYTHSRKPDDQWLYLPALKRVKRITSSNKSGPFMGSEFAYEDMTSQEVDKYTYRYLGDETLDGRATFKLERIPAYEKSGYTRQLVWMDQEMYQPLQLEFYDRKNSLLKTLKLKQYRQYLDRYWRAHLLEMQNHQTGKSTDLVWQDYKFGNGYSDRDFDRNSLKRAR